MNNREDSVLSGGQHTKPTGVDCPVLSTHIAGPRPRAFQTSPGGPAPPSSWPPPCRCCGASSGRSSPSGPGRLPTPTRGCRPSRCSPRPRPGPTHHPPPHPWRVPNVRLAPLPWPAIVLSPPLAGVGGPAIPGARATASQATAPQKGSPMDSLM